MLQHLRVAIRNPPLRHLTAGITVLASQPWRNLLFVVRVEVGFAYQLAEGVDASVFSALPQDRDVSGPHVLTKLRYCPAVVVSMAHFRQFLLEIEVLRIRLE